MNNNSPSPLLHSHEEQKGEEPDIRNIDERHHIRNIEEIIINNRKELVRRSSPSLRRLSSEQVLTDEAVKHPFETKMVYLLELGFTVEQADSALKRYEDETLEIIVQNILDPPSRHVVRLPMQDEEEKRQQEAKRRRHSNSLSMSITGSARIIPEDLHEYSLCYCDICVTDKEQFEFYTGECGCSFCKSCFRESYRVQIVNGKVLDLVCIGPDCQRKIEPEELYNFISGDDELISKYEKFRHNAILRRNENTRWCPTPGCETGIVGSPEQPKLRCTRDGCDTYLCFFCGREWHEGSCTEKLDELYSRWASQMGRAVHRCPKCGQPINKDGGCNHVTCLSCNYEFCWLCYKKYEKGHYDFDNLDGCPNREHGEYETPVDVDSVKREIKRRKKAEANFDFERAQREFNNEIEESRRWYEKCGWFCLFFCGWIFCCPCMFCRLLCTQCCDDD